MCLCCDLTTAAYFSCSFHRHHGSAATVPCLRNICDVCADTVTSLHRGGNGCVDVATNWYPILSHAARLCWTIISVQPSPPSHRCQQNVTAITTLSLLSKECGSHHHPHRCQQNVAAIITICCHQYQYLAVISYCHYPLSSLLLCQLKGCRKCDIIRWQHHGAVIPPPEFSLCLDCWLPPPP